MKITLLPTIAGITLIILIALAGQKADMEVPQQNTQPTVTTVSPGSLPSHSKDSVTLACYDHKTDTIYLDTYYIRHSDHTLQQVMNHELTHRKQWQEHPILTTLNHLLPYDIRPIEKEARENENLSVS